MKTLDGLLRYISASLPDGTFLVLVRQAGSRGLTLREYVGRRVLEMASERATGLPRTFAAEQRTSP